ncbi:hypothetical protein F511_08645 [Dorcoceras hygrometricum]|uniref:Uncharacterized protein n=1 Tax=Dorcoceras hygrometricum TaxID=472368 RepID=A0A2Z7ARD9_9LAMI|nr:hypothetical protein F511_08645 [Dorcoceras hygrometricum]
MMMSAVMSSQSAVDKKRKSWINDDDVSSDVITFSNSADGFCDDDNQQRKDKVNPDESYSTTSHWVIQSQATMYPVVGYSVLHIQSTGNPDASYSDSVASTSRPTSGQPAASTDFQMLSLPPAGQPDAVVEDTTSSEAVDELYYEDSLKLDVKC